MQNFIVSRAFAALSQVALAIAACMQSQPAHAAVSEKPALVVNDPFAAPLWRIDVDSEEKFVAAGSPAKAAAVFPIDDPKSVELLRVPLRDEEMQRAHAVAISPDGKLVAYAVPPLRDEKGFARLGTAVIYVVDRAGRQIVKTIDKDVPTRPQALRFSPDGTHLAATLSDGCGLRMWRTMDWGLTASDDDGYGDDPTCNTVAPNGDRDTLPDTPGLAYGRDNTGQLWLVTSGDTGVRAYKQSGDTVTLAAKKSPQEIAVERPEGVAFSPKGDRIAVGDARRRGQGGRIRLAIAVLDVASLTPASEPLAVPDEALLSPALLDLAQTPTADQMSLNRVAWGASGGEEFIMAGGVLWCQIASPALVLGTGESDTLDICMVRWRIGASGEQTGGVTFMRAGLDRVMDIAVLPRRQAVLYATQQRVAALAMDGGPYVNEQGVAFTATARALDLRDRPLDSAAGTWIGFHISDDASIVYVEDYRSIAASPIGLKFDVNQLRLERVDTPPPGVSPANRDPFIIDPTANWWNQVRKPPAVYGMGLDVLKDTKDTYRVVALGSDRHAVIGSSNFVRVASYESEAAKIECELRVSAEAYRAAVSADGTLAVIGHGDGTLRWYRILPRNGGGCELEALLAVHIRQTEWGRDEWTWTAWVPSTGRFASDGRARDALGWQTQDAGGQVSLVRFADLLKFYAPDQIKQALKRKKPDLVAVASLQKSIKDSADGVRLMLLAPDDGEDIESAATRFDFKVSGGGTWPRKLQVMVDGNLPAAKKHAGRDYGPGEPVEIAAAGIVQLDVILPKAALTRQRMVPVCFRIDQTQACRTVNWLGAIEPPPPRALHAVIAGFSDYANPEMKLQFAQNDALDLAKLFVADYQVRAVTKTSKVAPDFEKVSIDMFVAPTTEHARAELASLEKSGVVKLHAPDIPTLRSVLAKLGETATSGGAGNDLTLFYFSGHGLLNPYRDTEGLTALLGPGIEGTSREALEINALSSDELIRSLEPLGGDKIVILDACRTSAANDLARAFDPAAVSLEFERHLLSADVFFSAEPGQFSLDQSQYAFDSARPEGERGNGLFTYAILNSLTGERGGSATSGVPRQVEVFDVDRYVRRFFDARDAESAAQKLVTLLRSKGMSVSLQNPMFVPARRRPGATTVLRTLE